MEYKPLQPQPEQKPTPKPKPAGTFAKVLVLIALVVLLVVGILLPIKLVPNALTTAGDGLAFLFTGKKPITLSTDVSDIKSGSQFTLKWDDKNTRSGTYVFSYTCQSGVRLLTTVNQPNEEIHCDAPFYINAEQRSIILTPISDVNRFVDIPITLSFLGKNQSEPTKLTDALISVTNTYLADNRGSNPQQTSTSTPSSPVNPATTTPATPITPRPSSSTGTQVVRNSSRPVSNPNGRADLNIILISTGYVNVYTNQFVPSYTVPANGRAAIQFQVVNSGDKNTGAWSFRAVLPSSTHPTYTSVAQQNLGPGDYIVYTLSFDNFYRSGTQNLSITVDPNSYVSDSNRNNNVLTTTLRSN